MTIWLLGWKRWQFRLRISSSAAAGGHGRWIVVCCLRSSSPKPASATRSIRSRPTICCGRRNCIRTTFFPRRTSRPCTGPWMKVSTRELLLVRAIRGERLVPGSGLAFL
uniref:Putative secreted protein n=1 Tax=Anopheles darlingi TaxID=43151 RepID=A0A2M4DHA6_ANODA